MTAALDYWPSPPPWGWSADDLDHLPSEGPNGEPDFFKHVELIDGALIFMSPQMRFHERLINGLRWALNEQAPPSLAAVAQMDVRIDDHTRMCPDVVLIERSVADEDCRTYYAHDEVHLAVEVVSPESRQRDRKLKPPRYAEAGIAHMWRVEESEGQAVVYVSELDPAIRSYALTGIHHGRLTVPVPFPIDIDLDHLPR